MLLLAPVLASPFRARRGPRRSYIAAIASLVTATTAKPKRRKARFSHARDLTDAQWQADVSDERIFNSIMNGRNVRGNMPRVRGQTQGKRGQFAGDFCSRVQSSSSIDVFRSYMSGLKRFSTFRGLLILALQAALILVLVGAGWLIYRRLPASAAEARSSQRSERRCRSSSSRRRRVLVHRWMWR